MCRRREDIGEREWSRPRLYPLDLDLDLDLDLVLDLDLERDRLLDGILVQT